MSARTAWYFDWRLYNSYPNVKLRQVAFCLANSGILNLALNLTFTLVMKQS